MSCCTLLNTFCYNISFIPLLNYLQTPSLPSSPAPLPVVLLYSPFFSFLFPFFPHSQSFNSSNYFSTPSPSSSSSFSYLSLFFHLPKILNSHEIPLLFFFPSLCKPFSPSSSSFPFVLIFHCFSSSLYVFFILPFLTHIQPLKTLEIPSLSDLPPSFFHIIPFFFSSVTLLRRFSSSPYLSLPSPFLSLFFSLSSSIFSYHSITLTPSLLTPLPRHPPPRTREPEISLSDGAQGHETVWADFAGTKNLNDHDVTRVPFSFISSRPTTNSALLSLRRYLPVLQMRLRYMVNLSLRRALWCPRAAA